MDLVHAGHEGCLAKHPFHVVDIDADVFGRDVSPVQGVDESAEGAEQGFGLVAGRVADDDCLAAAEIESRHRILVGHATRQAQHIVDRLLLALVRPHAQATKGRSEHGVVDGDDGLKAGILVVAENHFFMAGGREGFKNHDGLRKGKIALTMTRQPAVYRLDRTSWQLCGRVGTSGFEGLLPVESGA